MSDHSDQQQPLPEDDFPIQPTGYDGWEHAHAYNEMMRCAAVGRAWVALPQVKTPTGHIAVLHTDVESYMWSLRDLRTSVRVYGLIGFVCGANQLAAIRIARAIGGS